MNVRSIDGLELMEQMNQTSIELYALRRLLEFIIIKKPLACTRRAVIPLMLLFCISSLGHSETWTIKERLVRFDGKPAAGATVQVLSERGYTKTRTDFKVTADSNGVFSADVPQKDSQWMGYIIVRAEGCAVATEVGIIGLPKSDSRMLELRLQPAYRIEGRTMDVQGRAVSGTTVSLVKANLQNFREIPLNSITTYPITTADFTARSASDGT
jgi:hypothetical protein